MKEIIDNKILIIDNDSRVARELLMLLTQEGYVVKLLSDKEEVFEITNQEFYNVIVLNMGFDNPSSSLELMGKVKEISPYTEFIVVTNFLSIESTIQALNQGAFAYVTKPIKFNNMIILVTKAINKQRIMLEKENLLMQLTGKTEKLERINRMRAEALMSYVEINNKLEDEIKAMKNEVNQLLIKAGKSVKYTF